MSPWLDSSWRLVLEGLQSKAAPHAWCIVHPPGVVARIDRSTGPFAVMPKPDKVISLVINVAFHVRFGKHIPI